MIISVRIGCSAETVLMLTCNLFYIPVNLTSREDHPWSFFPPSFGAPYTRFVNQTLLPMVAHPRYVFIFNLTIHNINGCRSVNKQFSIDSFLTLEGHHWGFFQTTAPSYLLSSDHSIRLAISCGWLACRSLIKKYFLLIVF